MPYGRCTIHSWGEWTSNGNGTHTRTCATDSSHTETGNCSGGKATGTEKAICETCHTAYGELLPLTKTVITTPPTLPSEGYVGDWYLDEDLEGGEAKVEGTDERCSRLVPLQAQLGGRSRPGRKPHGNPLYPRRCGDIRHGGMYRHRDGA